MSHAPNSLEARDIAYTLHGYTNAHAHEDKGPVVVSQGKGIYVYDDDGREFIEGMAGLWCTSLGFSEQRLIDAAVRQMQVLPYMHSFAHRTTEPVVEVCERLVKMAPAPMSKAFLLNSGSEAIDTAIKIIWYYNNALGRREKKKIISRKRGYHGMTVAGGSLTAIPLMQNDFDLPVCDRFLHTEVPSHYRHGLPGESEEEFASRLAGSLEQLIISEGPDTVAAFVAEPVMGAGGVIVPPRSYYQKVQAVLKKYDVLFLADEVICGFGRTGNMWGSETFDIKPDMLTCAKQLSSAYLPISAVLISEPIYQAMASNADRHGVLGMGYTYGGHPVAAAVAAETLRIYEERDMIGHVRTVMGRFQERLHGLADHPLVGEARGVGLVGAVEIVADKHTREQFDPSVKAAARISDRAFDDGLIVRGLPGDAVACCPPLIITEQQIDDLFDRFRKGLDDAAGELGQRAA